MSQLPVLTQLCPICYVNPPKYTCPRCSMRTCSLSCTQTHRTRASCSGVRDPAKYIPRREMKSSTVDMDFNFLKKVQSTKDRGLSELEKLEKEEAMTKRRKMESARRRMGVKKAEERGVKVKKMAGVMERMKMNRTRWDAE